MGRSRWWYSSNSWSITYCGLSKYIETQKYLDRLALMVSEEEIELWEHEEELEKKVQELISLELPHKVVIFLDFGVYLY